MRALLPLVVLTLTSTAWASSFRIAGDDDARPVDAPYALTASDGSGLRVVALEASAVVTGPLAFTEMRFTFANPQDRVIEGRFRVTLPEGAAVSRFAMKTSAGWQEGEVIEKERARRVYEDFLHRKQDPALLEQAAGNEFRARVFPIPARGEKEIILSYSHQIQDPKAAYRLPLRGLAEVGRLRVSVDGDAKGAIAKGKWVPDRDLVVERTGELRGLAHGQGFLTPVVPVAGDARDPVSSLLVLFDTSASQALGFDQRVKRLARLIDGLAQGAGPKTPVRVAAFDQQVKLIYQGPAAGFADQGARTLRRRRAMGASDLGRALVWAAENARGMERLLLLSDGVPTLGKTEAGELQPALKRLEATGLKRMDAVVTGGVRDTELLRQLLDVELPRAGAVIDGDGTLASIADKLERRTLREVKVAVKGARWVWPSALQGVQAGEVRWVFAESAARSVSVGGKPIKVRYEEVTGPLVDRQLRAAQIAHLVAARGLEGDKVKRAKLKEEIVKLSVEHRVLSPFTALLVLETADDYARYGIDRKSLTEILVVEKGRVVARSRANIVVPPRPVAKVDKPMKKKPKAKRTAREGESEDNGDSPADDAAPRELKEEAAEADEDGLDEAEKVAEVMADPSAEPPPAAPPPPPSVASPEPEMERRRESRPAPRSGGGQAEEPIQAANPWAGKYKRVRDLIAKGKKREALQLASGWREEDPKDVLAIVALGDAFAALGRNDDAARAYASIIDLFPSRADLRRFAGNLLEALKGEAFDIAADSYAKARAQRADHPASHRMLAFARVKQRRHEEAFVVLEEAVGRSYPDGRFRGVDRILREDLGLVAAAWTKAAPKRRAEIQRRLKQAGGVASKGASLRFILTWETDANDVDFHIYDGKGGHAFYSQPNLASGGQLYADVTTGYGPECFTIEGARGKRRHPYRLRAHYYSRGPMGYGMGKLQVIDHDGKGGLRFEEHPYVVMNDSAYIELGRIK